MRQSSLKRTISFFAVFTGIIIIAQVYWLQKLYSFEQRQFTTNVVKSMLALYEDIELVNGPVVRLQQFIQQPDANTFIMRIDSIPDKDSLEYYTNAELEDFDVFTNCNLYVFDHKNQQYAYTAGLHSGIDKKFAGGGMQAQQPDYSFIQFSFPGRANYVMNEMKWWIVLALLLTLSLAALGASMIYLYRQRFLHETQNDFIRNITHEFQTPLTTFNLGLDMLSKPDVRTNPDKIMRYAGIMQAQTNYLQHHVANLVKLIRADSFGLQLVKEEVYPQKLIQDALLQLDLLITEKSSVISFFPLKDEAAIKADKANLYLVILNVLSNALKFSQHPHIVITARPEDKLYVISVSDNGIGIEKKYHKLLFKKFYRVPTGDVHSVKGLGLGLYFVKKIVLLHHGKIEVSSTPGKGTQVKISLPFN